MGENWEIHLPPTGQESHWCQDMSTVNKKRFRIYIPIPYADKPFLHHP
jgi:hypothetical protein